MRFLGFQRIMSWLNRKELCIYILIKSPPTFAIAEDTQGNAVLLTFYRFEYNQIMGIHLSHSLANLISQVFCFTR